MLYPSENYKTCLLLPCYEQLDFHMLQSFISTASIFSALLPVRGYKIKVFHLSLVTQKIDKHIQGTSAQPKQITLIYINI